MRKPRKPNPSRIIARLSRVEQHELYEFLRTNTYDEGCRWLLREKGIVIAPSTLGLWWGRYALAWVDNAARVEAHLRLRIPGNKITKKNLEELIEDFILSHEERGLTAEIFLRFWVEKRKAELMARRTGKPARAVPERVALG